MKVVKSIAPPPEELTIEKLKTFPGLEHISDEYAQQILDTFEGLAQVAFEFVMDEELKKDKRSNNGKSY